VGSFADGMAHLEERGWTAALRAEVGAGKPLLGICLGMQLLASHGTEGGDTPGLDLVPGAVRRLEALGCALRVPHVGWNAITPAGSGGGLFAAISPGTDFYFVHSYAFVPESAEHVLARTDYGVPVVAAVARGNVFGTQFHPEKSSRAGLRLLRNFLEGAAC
jgi:glutamine amidotransferase